MPANGSRLLAPQLFEDVMAQEMHLYARSLAEGNRSRSGAECWRLADLYVHRCTFENMLRNCDANGVRYEWIPMDSEICPWCMTQASSGFVYHSEETASHGRHVGCDCIVLPGRASTSHRDATQVDDYDPDEWYAIWADAGFKGAGSGSSHTHARRHEPTISAEESMKLQRELLCGFSKADRERAMDIILNANDVRPNERHDVDVHNHIADRVQRAMPDNHITNKDLAERAWARIEPVEDRKGETHLSLSGFHIDVDHLPTKQEAIRMAIEADKPVFCFIEDPIYTDGRRVRLGDEFFHTIHHGTATTAILFGQEVMPEEFWGVLQPRVDYTGGPIALISCSTGDERRVDECFARRLSELSGETVYGATKKLWTNGTLSYIIKDEMFEEDEPNGYFKLFKAVPS